MMKKTLAFVIGFFISMTVLADPIANFIDSYTEQEKIVIWITENTKTNMSEERIRETVRMVYAKSQTNGLDPHFVLGMILQESKFNTRAKSFAGAAGLMQVIPRWHRDKIGNRNIYNPVVNVDVGVDVLVECIQRNKNNIRKAVSCYSGGANQYYRKVTNHQKKFQVAVKQDSFPTLLLMAMN